MDTVLVTGASHPDSLGVAICKALLAKNIAVLNLDKEVVGLDDWPETIIADLYHPSQIALAVSKLPGKILGVVHAAGVNHQGFVEDTDAYHWMEMMRVNAFAPVLLAKHLINSGRLGKGSFICNIISNASHIPMTASNGYNASKGALHIATLQMARELTPRHGISVFGISPNKLAGTGMSKQIEHEVKRVRGWDAEYARQYQLNALLNKEETPPATVARFLANIISDPEQTKFLSGCVLPFGA